MKKLCSFSGGSVARKIQILLYSFMTVSLLTVSHSYAKNCYCDAAGCSNGDGVVYSSSSFDYSQCTTLNGKPYPSTTTPVSPVSSNPPEISPPTSQDGDSSKRVATLAVAVDRQRVRWGTDEWDAIHDSDEGQGSCANASVGSHSTDSYYVPSELPVWDFGVYVQGGIKESEIELAPSIGLKSDVKSIAFSMAGTKESLHFKGQFFYTSLKGTGANDGEDTESYGLLLVPGYRLFTQNANGINFDISPFIELYQNDFTDEGNQTRYVLGASMRLSAKTPVGGLSFGYLFSHDRNANNDIEITGDEYLNLHTVSVQHLFPLMDSLLFSSKLGYMWVMDMPDGMDEDSSVDLAFALNYYGWENWTIALGYEKSIDGFESQGVNLRVAHHW